MRALWFMIMLAACRIPDENFVKGDGGGIDDDAMGSDAPADAGLGALAQRAYLKASNSGTNGLFGMAVALSADGSTLAVGAAFEAGGAAGVNGNQADTSVAGAGAVYVFTRAGTTWSQQAYVKASNPGVQDNFGSVIALSADGSTLAVSAPGEDSAAVGIGGNQADNAAAGSGALYVFTRAGTTWSQQAYVKASNTGATDAFGISLALSNDGATLAVGANREDSQGFGNQTDNTLTDAGAAYVFVRTGATWNQQAYLKALNPGGNDQYGGAVTLSGDGSTIAVGAYFEDGGATGVGGTPDEGQVVSGAVYVLTRLGSTWTHQAYVKASNTGSGDLFGSVVTLSADGTTLAVSAYGEKSAATGIDGNQADDTASTAGAVYVFTRAGATWSQQAYVKASNTAASDYFGYSFVGLSGDGSTMAVGAMLEDSAAVGIGGVETDDNASEAGAAYLYRRSGTTWAQLAYIKSSNAERADRFGDRGALSANGSVLAIGAALEDSAAVGADGNQADNGALEAGAVYIFQ
ncbi:MAG: integrin [Deltaproteobacteria bacterium]|nr:integrin [Deltaproteobacteria bacterium]